jgi:hypothetical protein
MSELEDKLEFELKAIGYHPEKEVKFHPSRRWRFDFVIGNLAIEVEGGIWMNKSRHTSSKGFINDCEKYAEALILGYRVIRIPGDWVNNGKAIGYIERALK